ncbi:hypothetical protein ATCC90586_005743 [Pythium insidiosum]|nr:hypothetical protein ATCC90586_005743 [Pythium insidiosum]
MSDGNVGLLAKMPLPPTTTTTTTTMPSVKDFYEGLYFSPIYAKHHRVTCNVGFQRLSDCAGQDEELPTDLECVAQRFHEAHTPNDLHQLQLYRELLAMMETTGDSAKQGLQDSDSLSILDAGCGPGGGVCAIQSCFPRARITGVDISSQAIVRSKENWLGFSRHLRHEMQLPNGETLDPRPPRWINQSCEHMSSISSASMDVVCAVQCLQEVQNVTAAVNEIARVLRPGGVLLIADFIPQDPNRDRLYLELLEEARSTDESTWMLEQERLVTVHTALACKQNSARMEQLIQTHIPSEFRPDLETLFFVKDSMLYDQLQRGEMGYRFVCLRKRQDPMNPFSPNMRDGGECVDDVEGDDEEEGDEDEDDIYDDDLPNFYSYREFFPELEVLKTHYDVIREEMEAVMQGTSWPFWPEKHYTEGESEWRVFPFCYTFPAHDATKTTWVNATSAMCPRTVAILQSIPNLRTALFSKLGPNTTLSAHRGWADLSNHILRCHLGLIVPTLENGKPCCSMVVGGEVVDHAERELMVFDDSKLHYAYNNHPEQTRLVLIVDLYRPDHLPRGRATGGHTDELDEFIENFGQQAFGGDDSDSEDT